MPRQHILFICFHTRHPEETCLLYTTSEKHFGSMRFFFPVLGLRWESRQEMRTRGKGCTYHRKILPYNNESETPPHLPIVFHTALNHIPCHYFGVSCNFFSQIIQHPAFSGISSTLIFGGYPILNWNYVSPGTAAKPQIWAVKAEQAKLTGRSFKKILLQSYSFLAGKQKSKHLMNVKPRLAKEILAVPTWDTEAWGCVFIYHEKCCYLNAFVWGMRGNW